MAIGIGERLREARRARGLNLDEVAERTKIRSRYLRALEDEDWEIIPGTAYVRGFLHAYAESLGLDADGVVDEYRRDRESAEEEAVDAETIRTTIAKQPPLRSRGRVAGGLRFGRGTIAGIVVAALVGIVVVLGLVGDSEEGTGEPAGNETPADSGASEPTTTTEALSRVTLRLTATGTVWACVVDQDGQPVVEGVTLPAGEKEGPFRGRSFEVGLGNGQVEMEANGEPVEIPAAANPLGYRVTPEGASELAPSQRPTCA
jgi:cytoskeleton protein RodZ